MQAATPDFVTNPNTLQMGASGVILAKNIADVLNKKYPGHLWAVNVDEKGGVANVFNLALSGRWGFVLHINRIDNDFKAVMRAGGEILERYRLHRGGVRPDHIAASAMDFAGNRVFDRD